MTTIAAVLFWLSVTLLLYTHMGYPVVLAFLTRTRMSDRRRSWAPTTAAALPTVSLIIPAYDEEKVIATRVENALALDYPRERIQVIVASDGSTDRTAELARAAGAGLVLELPPGGKVAALNAAVEHAAGDILAFSDANSVWARDALRRLVAPFADPGVGYVCGQVRFRDPDGDNLEGLYWRYEMGIRAMESELAGITAGNGAIYAVRRDAYLALDPAGSHDLSFPFLLPSAASVRSMRLAPARRRRWCRPSRGRSPANAG